MFTVLDAALLAASLVIAAPLTIFLAECLLALLPARSAAEGEEFEAPPRVAVLIPAHNEAAVIEATLAALLPTLSAEDRVLVVADNCTDDTARRAAAAGARVQVVERTHATLRAKGYALDYGVQALRADPPDVLVVLDADCLAAPGAVRRLAQAAHRTGRPAQARYLCDADPVAEPLQAVSALGLRFKNWIRPLGLARLGLPCHLMGTGMALPWSLAESAPLATSNLVEDMNLGLDLALAGHPALFVPEACVDSVQPPTAGALVGQRTRWEHGHLSTSLALAPRLLATGLWRGRLDLIALALDLVVPPVSLLLMAWFGATVCVWIAWWCGAHLLPAVVLTAVGGGTLLATAACWWVYCRESIPLATLLGIPWYMLRKLPIYLEFLWKPQSQWVRTERQGA